MPGAGKHWFYRPSCQARYRHIDALVGEQVDRFRTVAAVSRNATAVTRLPQR